MLRALAGLAALSASGCAPGVAVEPAQTADPGIRVYALPAPSAEERYCAWYGEAGDGVLYFGQAPFWSSYRAGELDPRADLRHAGPRPIGRFDLDLRQMLPPLETGPRPDGSETRSGVWDVLPLRGRVHFTTYFEEAGHVDLQSGKVRLYEGSRHWNELAAGPVVSRTEGFSTTSHETLLVSRYADRSQGGGAVLVVDVDGRVLRELKLPAPEGVALAAKTPAWDPAHREIWVTTDRLPLPPADDEHTPFPRPALVLDLEGREIARFGTPEEPVEVQFVRFDTQGLGYAAVSRDGRLELVALSPTGRPHDLAGAPTAVLDDSFAAGLDFAQDIQIGPDGSAYVTRWSGLVHEVTPGARRVRTWRLPREEDALYYSAVPAGPNGSLCATRCGDVEVVCASRPRAGTR